MPTARYNKQQICGILLQFRAGLGSGVCEGARCTAGSPPGGRGGGTATLPSLHGVLSAPLQSEKLPSPLFLGAVR